MRNSDQILYGDQLDEWEILQDQPHPLPWPKILDICWRAICLRYLIFLFLYISTADFYMIFFHCGRQPTLYSTALYQQAASIQFSAKCQWKLAQSRCKKSFEKANYAEEGKLCAARAELCAQRPTVRKIIRGGRIIVWFRDPQVNDRQAGRFTTREAAALTGIRQRCTGSASIRLSTAGANGKPDPQCS